MTHAAVVTEKILGIPLHVEFLPRLYVITQYAPFLGDGLDFPGIKELLSLLT